MKKVTVLLWILMLCALCLALASCGETDTGAPETTDTPQSTTPAVTTVPEEPRVAPEEIVVGKVRVQLLSDSLVRLEVAMSGNKFQDKASFSVVNRDDWFKVDYETVEEGDNTVIKTANYHVVLPKDASNLNKAVILSPDGEELWHYESKTNSDVFLPSPSDELDSWYFTDNPRVIPSEYGYSLPADGSYTANNGFTTDRMATDCFVFLPRGSYENFMQNFIELTGRSEMITLNLLGYWDSRWYTYTESTAIQQIKDYQSKGYSIDVLVIDTDWRDASRGVGYEINTSLFPDMARFLEEAHELGVTVVFNDHPEPATGTNNLLDEDEIEYRSENLKMILSLGLDYWWYDRNWSVALNSIDPELSIYTTGMYAFQWITEDYYNSITNEELGEYARRALIMANVDGIWNGEMTDPTEIAAHRYTLQWTGDIGTSAESLKKEIYNAIYGSNEMGIPYISADLGGHTSEVSDEMYVRWMQFGAFTTVCRVHCTKPFSRMPWIYGDIAESVTKEYVGMRYRLLPLYYALAHENYETGLPLLRRLDISYPQYVEASASDEYLLGDYLLIAPLSGREIGDIDTSIFSADGKAGLKVEYFKNNNLSGTPAYTGYDTNISHDWLESGPSEIGNLAENFSARWTGTVTPDEDMYLWFYADDGIKVWIDGEQVVNGWTVYDTYLNSNYLTAGKTYEIKIEYCEYGGKAHMLVGSSVGMEEVRDVFLPDGVWMDVWTGKEYTGPCTITVAHGLETSPIFVRQGAIVPLVSQAQNTSEIDWSKITLDVYPSADYAAEAVIYEDDYTTVAYKEGQYRTTNVTMDYANNVLFLKIGATNGTYKDAPKFTERAYTVRLHLREKVGDVFRITVDGKDVRYTIYNKSAESTPFIETGAALDADIVEFTVTKPLTEATDIKISFYNPVEGDGRNEDYDDTAVKFTVVANTITKNSMNNLNLTEKGDLDWAMYGATTPDSIIYKKNGKGWISATESWDSIYEFSDNYTIRWTDGDTTTSGSSTRGPVSGRNFDVTLKTDGSKLTYTIYLGGYKSVAKITVRDRAGNVETLTFGNLSTNFYRQIVIECDAGEAGELYINYSLLTGDNITFSAVTASAG